MNKASELRGKDVQSLNKELDELQQKHFKLKMQHGSGQLNNTDQLRKVRKAIARARTVLNETKRASS